MKKLQSLNKRLSLVTAVGALLVLGSPANVLAVPPDKVHFGPTQVFGFYTAGCETFAVLADFTVEGFFVVHYDKDGNMTHGPGEGENDRFVYTGESPFLVITGPFFKITLPGAGVIFHQAGRTVFDLNTFEVLFQAGPSDFTDGNVDALCAALTP